MGNGLESRNLGCLSFLGLGLALLNAATALVCSDATRREFSFARRAAPDRMRDPNPS